MTLKKNFILFSVLFFSFSLFTSSCDKDEVTDPNTTNCDARALYAGTATASAGNTSPMVYEFRDNNFAVGYVTVGAQAVTFGGYRNTCDSVIISSYYTSNNAYYLLKGILNSSKTVITGTYQTVSGPSSNGTFTMTKQ